LCPILRAKPSFAGWGCQRPEAASVPDQGELGVEPEEEEEVEEVEMIFVFGL
jgi:hypothetical protein